MVCRAGPDGYLVGDCLSSTPLPKDTTKIDNRQDWGKQGRVVDYNFDSNRQNRENLGYPATFVDGEDYVALVLLYNLQKKKPLESYSGYKLTRLVLSDEALVYGTIEGRSAIVCLVGQNIATNSQHLVDDLNIAGATANSTCQLRLARVGDALIKSLKDLGFSEIILCGYSLGGAAVACVADQATRGIIFNGGAPPTNSARPSPDNCHVYHIVGDILSTHWIKAKRIYLVESNSPREQNAQNLQTDGVQWYDIAYYHDMDRFMEHGGPFKIVTPQFEQNSLENYMFYKSGEASDILGDVAGLLSVNFNFRRKIQLTVCGNPIPGSYASRACNESKPSAEDQAIGAILGGAIGAAALGTASGGVGFVGGASAGATAGAALASGEKGILDLINPDLTKKAVELGETVVSGASALDSLNNQKGGFSGQIQYDETPRQTMDRLVVRPR